MARLEIFRACFSSLYPEVAGLADTRPKVEVPKIEEALFFWVGGGSFPFCP